MFTGIIQEVGRVKELRREGGAWRLSIISKGASRGANAGESIAVNGVCLTVVRAAGDELTFDVIDESLRRTNLGGLGRGAGVNLETALRAGDKISGHLLSGHIDGTGRIQSITGSGQTCRIHVEFPALFGRYIVPKGSIALDGVSLTVAETGQDCLCVYIIPHTLKSTRFGSARAGDRVNIELDMLAKYAAGGASQESGITEDFLKGHKFI